MPEVRIAFTSCADTDKDKSQPIWNAITAKNPDYVLFLGDVIYMDWGNLGAPYDWLQTGDTGYQKFATEMHRRYAAQWRVTEFQAMLGALRNKGGLASRFLCTWDDHDFGWNNCCGNLPPVEPSKKQKKLVLDTRAKAISKALQRQFVHACTSEPAVATYPTLQDSGLPPNFSPPADGLGLEKTLAISELNNTFVELLDTRWYRTPYVEGHPQALLLGETQLHALETRLRNSTRRFSAIASSVPYFHHFTFDVSGWSGTEGDKNSPTRPRPDYIRFQQLLKSVPSLRDNSVFLSGDTHNNNRIADDLSTYRQFESSPAVPRPIAFAGDDPCFGLLSLTGALETGSITCRVEQFKNKSGSFEPDKKLKPYTWSTYVS